MAYRQKVIHIHSNVYADGVVKAPTSSLLEYGELAINYNSTYPSLFLRDNDNNIRQIHTTDKVLSQAILGDTYKIHDDVDNDDLLIITSGDTVVSSIGKLMRIITDNEEVTASGLSDLDQRLDKAEKSITTIEANSVDFETRISDLEGDIHVSNDYTPVSYRQLQNSGVTFTAVQPNDTIIDVATKLDANVSTLVSEIVDNELAIAESITSIDKRTNENINNITSLSGIVETLSQEIIDDELTISEALNELNKRTIITKYSNPSYPEIDDITFDQIISGDTFVSATKKLDANIATLANNIVENELVVSQHINDLIDRDSVIDDTINYIKTDTNELRNNINTISGTVSTLKNEVNALSGTVATLKEYTDYHSGYSTVTTLSNLMSPKRLVKANLTSNASLSISGSLIKSGYEQHIIVKNEAATDIIITIPTTGVYINLSEDTKTLGAGEYAEINILSDGTNYYIRAI